MDLRAGLEGCDKSLERRLITKATSEIRGEAAHFFNDAEQRLVLANHRKQ
jgi:hypothetical protein